jgi:hypothetical protein
MRNRHTTVNSGCCALEKKIQNWKSLVQHVSFSILLFPFRREGVSLQSHIITGVIANGAPRRGAQCGNPY